MSKSISVHFLPELGLPVEVIESTPGERAGYGLSAAGEVPTYRVWVGNQTTLYPESRVHKIVLNF